MPAGEVASVVLPEWSQCGPQEQPVLRGLWLDAPARALAADLHRMRVVSIREQRDGLAIETRSHVGRLRLGPLRLTIVPKLGDDVLPTLFRYAYSLGDVRRRDLTEYGGSGHLFEDLLAEQLRLEVELLLTRGLRRAYEPREAWLPTVRGRIDLHALAGGGGSTLAALPCRFHARIEDSQLNRVLLAGLRLAARVCGDRGLATKIRRLAHVLGREIGELPLSGALLERTRRALDRLTEGYRPALELVTLLYDGHEPALDAESTSLRLPGFSFDMNRFFQALIHRLLRDNLEPYEVLDERGLAGMFAYLPHANPHGRRAPTPRPDFTIRDRGRTVAVLDAKYRDLWSRSLPREMLYQLALYAVGQAATDEAVILYPTVATDAREARIGLRDPWKGSTLAQVVLRPVPLRRLVELLSAGTDARARADLVRLARELASVA